MVIFIFAFLKEFLSYLGLGILLFSFFFFFGESSKILEASLLMAGSDLGLFMKSLGFLYSYYWLSIAGLLLPMALALSVTLTISRLHEDHELLAFETLGVAISRYLKAILFVLAACAIILQIPLVHKTMPQARFSLKHFVFQGKYPTDKLMIEPKTWVDLGTVKLFAEGADNDHLNNVAIYIQEKSPQSGDIFFYKITAKKALYSLIQGPSERMLKLVLDSGKLEIPNEQQPGEVTTCLFGRYENYVPLNPPKAFKRKWQEHTTKELSQLAQTPNTPQEIPLEIKSRWNFVFSPLALVFVSGFLSFHLGKKSKGFGFGLSLSVLALYWICMALFSSLKMPWITNGIFMALGFIVYKLIPERL